MPIITPLFPFLQYLSFKIVNINFPFLCRMGRLQDSNAVLTHFNEYSEQCFAEVSSDFASKTRLLKSMKADLEHIFTKLRYHPVH